MSGRDYEGPALDATVQYITERPEQPGETVAATPQPDGEVSAENVPTPGHDRPEVEGQSTFEDWGWSR